MSQMDFLCKIVSNIRFGQGFLCHLIIFAPNLDFCVSNGFFLCIIVSNIRVCQGFLCHLMIFVPNLDLIVPPMDCLCCIIVSNIRVVEDFCVIWWYVSLIQIFVYCEVFLCSMKFLYPVSSGVNKGGYWGYLPPLESWG